MVFKQIAPGKKTVTVIVDPLDVTQIIEVNVIQETIRLVDAEVPQNGIFHIKAEPSDRQRIFKLLIEGIKVTLIPV